MKIKELALQLNEPLTHMAIPSRLNLLPKHRLFQIGLKHSGNIHYQEAPEELAAAALRLNQATLADNGALVIHTGKFTGRSPKDKFIVKDNLTSNTIHWNDFNIPIAEKNFDIIFEGEWPSQPQEVTPCP